MQAARKLKRQQPQDDVEIVDIVEDTVKNSDEFPADMRPAMFKDDKKLNRLDYSQAAQIVWEYQQNMEKKKEKQKKKNEN